MHRGINHYDDFRLHLRHQKFLTIFDVGANHGQTARDLVGKYPDAVIHCFEPNPDCYPSLKSFGDRVRIHQMALGDKVGEVGLDKSIGNSTMFFVTDELGGERVVMDTVDNFSGKAGIKHVDFLKIDTEGHDLKVIRGATNMLQRFEIDIVQAEVSLCCDNTFQVSMFDVQTAMEGFGYRLFGIYEQIREWNKNAPYLRNANVVYISPVVADANTTT